MKTRMKTLAKVVAIGAVAFLGVTACTTDGGSTTAKVASDDIGFLSQDQFDEITSELKTASAVPETPIPGASIDTSQLAGKKVLIMPQASFLTDCDIISKDMKKTAQDMGMKATYFQTDGTTASWVQGMQQAISQKYDMVVHVCGIDPDLISEQVKAATDAGIVVVGGGLYDNEVDKKTNALLTAQTNLPYYESFKATALQAIMDHRDKPFGVLLLTSNETASTPAMTKAAEDTFSKYCPDCTIKKVNVPFADMATKMTDTVQSALVADPKISVVMPMYGGTGATYAATALKSVNRADAGIYGAYGMPISDIKQMSNASSKYKGITRHNNKLRMATIWDQALRALTGAETVDPNKYVDKNRLVTNENAKKFIAMPNEGFGDEAVDAYEKLWGLDK
ncbi:MAG: sugar ABC transporter substrate-binding protein [Galactobacter sp.]